MSLDLGGSGVHWKNENTALMNNSEDGDCDEARDESGVDAVLKLQQFCKVQTGKAGSEPITQFRQASTC